ncbi:MAG TPA: tetratricopeptide repeat protein [Terracidiphilus sp.]|jgi:serine/threonine-protein kinase
MLGTVSIAESDLHAARRQLERVLASSGFSRNERMARFLRFVVEQHLEGKDSELKESVIAIEVFGRSADHDPSQDSIVRTEAGRLRARLDQYYRGEGKGDALVIELPKGGYAPVFRRPDAAAQPQNAGPKRRSRLGLTLSLLGLVALLGVVGWWGAQHPNTPIAIAVLPFENVSHDPANDYFADGLTDELIRNLSIIDGLAPRSRTSSFAFKGKARNVREAGTELSADYILEGSVLRAGQELRINAQLIRVRDDFPIWSGKFDRELTDVFAIQDEISRGIVNSLRLKLGGGRRRYETSVDAYDSYLRARAFESGTGDIPPSIGLFEEAVAKDSSFAPAYAGLAAAYAYTSATFPNLDHRDDQLVKMRSAAEKAIELDPLLAEAHAALAMAYSRDGQWEQSERNFRRAIELDPSRSASYGDLAMYLLLVLGRSEEALHELRVAERFDPLSSEIQFRLAYILISGGHFDEAASHCEKLPADFHQKSECLGRARVGQGRIGEAIQALATVGNRGYLGYAYAKAGRREEAEKVAADIAPNPFNQALVFAGLGDRDRTLDALERMDVLGPVRIGRALTFPEFAFVRGDPRTKALRLRVGLPE